MDMDIDMETIIAHIKISSSFADGEDFPVTEAALPRCRTVTLNFSLAKL